MSRRAASRHDLVEPFVVEPDLLRVQAAGPDRPIGHQMHAHPGQVCGGMLRTLFEPPEHELYVFSDPRANDELEGQPRFDPEGIDLRQLVLAVCRDERVTNACSALPRAAPRNIGELVALIGGAGATAGLALPTFFVSPAYLFGRAVPGADVNVGANGGWSRELGTLTSARLGDSRAFRDHSGRHLA